MAVAEQTPYKEYIANGVTNSFPLEFDCDDQDHLIVTVNDIEPENGQWSLINGAVVFGSAPANQAKIIIQRNTPLERNTDYQTYNNSFRPQPVNKDLDRIWWKLQELWFQITLIWAYTRSGFLNLQNQINELIHDTASKVSELWVALNQEITDRKTEDSKIRAWVIVLLNNIVDSGLVSAIAVSHVSSIDDLNALITWHGRAVHVDSYHFGLDKGGGLFIYDATRFLENDGGVCINGWVRQLENNVLNPFMFGAYGDFVPNASEVISRKSGHDDSEAFKKMYNMNKYTIFTNISKLPPKNVAEYTFEWGNAMFYIENSLPIRSYQFTDCKGGKIFFNPVGNKDLFTTPRQEMADAYKVSTGWNTQTICFGTFKNGVIVGNVSRTSTVHARKCFDGGNWYKCILENMLIERFAIGVHIYPLDTSAWTGGERIGNFYENELNNLTVHECITGVINSGNVTQATNLTIGGGYIVGKDYTNKINYLLMNGGAGFSCNGFNIAPSSDQGSSRALIYDGCLGSYYSGGYTEWFNTFFELDMQDRMGSFKLDASHIFKYSEHCLIKFSDGCYSKFDYSTMSRSVPNRFKDGRKYNNYLNTLGFGVGSSSDLITNFFKYCPQYDFKYGMYGVSSIPSNLIYDVKRFEEIDTGFTSKYGIRLINPTNSEMNLYLPLNNQSTQAKLVCLYRDIKNFDFSCFKSNVLGFNGTNARISTGELIVDYGNGWKLAVLEVTSELSRNGNFSITLPPNSQVEIEHIGAYANGYPFMPTYVDYQPLVNTALLEGAVNTNSGGTFDIGDITRAIANVASGTIDGSVSDNVVMSGGVYSSRYPGSENITLTANGNEVDLSETLTLQRLGVGAYVDIQQSGQRKKYTVVGRKFINNEFSKVLKFKGSVDLVSGYVVFYTDYMQKPVFRQLQYYTNNYLKRSVPYEGVVVAQNSITTTNISLDGAAMGGTAIVSVSPALGSDSRVWAEVTLPNQITVYHQNLTTNNISTPSGMVMTVKTL
ncbi:hypothetical protein [Acinetobacter ursingii]|uniref:Uncharacterized protein n=1 Tax=Acinetobacter ursingii TaxID=108980 RepID=A0AA46NX76_9GAMM|nr:hypothetical protein [Acinetobacter ursingii]UYF72786.1 hypothetical protein LSO60_05865 [Acinetobacter ursingii]